MEKQQLAAAIKAYRKTNGSNGKEMSQKHLSYLIGIKNTYLNRLEGGYDYTEVSVKGDKENKRHQPIKSTIITRVINFLNGGEFVAQNGNYKLQYKCLYQAKIYQEYRIIYGGTGLGKTTAAKDFKKQSQTTKATYLVRCADDMSSREVIEAVSEALGLKPIGTKSQIRKQITNAIRLQEDDNPLLIIDEAENLKESTYGAIKALCDDLQGYAGIVLIGANKDGKTYLDWLKGKAQRLRGCFPQIYSRFSTKPQQLKNLTTENFYTECKDILSNYDITDKYEIDIIKNELLQSDDFTFRGLDGILKRRKRKQEVLQKAEQLKASVN